MKLMKSFVLMCCIAVANGVPLTSLNVEETQELLRDWDLHDALGAEVNVLIAIVFARIPCHNVRVSSLCSFANCTTMGVF